MAYKNDTVERMMKEEGKCLPVSFPGMYTLIYIDEHNEVFCSDCATKNAENILAVTTYDEGPDMQCSDCGSTLESSYGDPNFAEDNV
jgi:DNA-directed RNA polymerase subunit RPC12/RpoP